MKYELVLIVALILQTQWRTYVLGRQIMAWGHRIASRLDDPELGQPAEDWRTDWKAARADLRKGQIGFWVQTAIIALLLWGDLMGTP